MQKLAVFFFMACTVTANEDNYHLMHKRQIFREELLPHSGGKIPEDAFRTDRLALNRLNAAGIAIPDGILLESRNRESHFPYHRDDPDIQSSIIKLIQKPDGRYAPQEGRYPFNNLVDSTYIIRKPISSNHHVLAPQHPIEVPFKLPAAPFFENEDLDLDHVDDSFNLLNTYNTDFPGSSLWSGFGPLFHDNSNRILRQTRKDLSRRNEIAKEIETGDYPSLSTIPRTQFKCASNLFSHIMIADRQTNCQVFHLCHVGGSMESFLCPKGMRFDSQKHQCSNWTEVKC